VRDQAGEPFDEARVTRVEEDDDRAGRFVDDLVDHLERVRYTMTAAIERELTTAPDDIRTSVSWLPLGTPVELAG
jgi:hypothetical protein